KYTDQTISSALSLSNTWVDDYHTFKATSEAGKTVEAILIAYSSAGNNTWYLKELQIEAGITNTSYEPHVSPIDGVARYGIENLNNKFSAVDEIGEKTETIYSDFYGYRVVSSENFELGNLGIPAMVYASSTTRVRTKEGIVIPLKKDDIVSLSTGVFYYGYYDSEGTIHSGSRWVSELTVPEDGDFVFAMRYSTEAVITDYDAFVSGFSVSTKGADIRNNVATCIDLFRTDRYYDHMLLNKTSGENVIIPLQSISSIYMSKRLGFKVLEANVVNTSDGHYIVTHGDAGKFGNYFEHVDGETDISATAINSVTLDWIKTNVRYKSLYPKYRTAPPTLEEYLTVCKTLKMIPLIQITNREGVASIADAIMGKDNYIAYNGNRRLNKGMIMIWRNITTKAEIIAECEKYGLPLMYGMDRPTVFTDEELTDIVETLHKKGIIIGFQDTYIAGALGQKYFQMGFDFCATTWEINDFMSGNIYNKVSDIDFSDFETNGTVTDDNLVLTSNQYVRIADQSVNFLSGVICYIRFSGALDIRICDGFRTNAYTSDGSNYVRISAGALSKAPIISMTATSTTTIYEIKCIGSKL
ncbi:MAG: hypothetical protein LIR46_14060, partial [Bacteroidota bacterium]|nr:hypothetical protein [Bacteroidota bacterium]